MTRFSVSDQMFSSLIQETRSLSAMMSKLSQAATAVWALHCSSDSSDKQKEAEADLDYAVSARDASLELMAINQDLRALKKRVRKLRKLARGTFIEDAPVERRLFK